MKSKCHLLPKPMGKTMFTVGGSLCLEEEGNHGTVLSIDPAVPYQV